MHDAQTDGMLLAEYAKNADDRAFEIVQRRHAHMVMGVCERMLRNEHDAEDAAQAVFMVLADKAHTLGGNASVAAWLHRVARHVCLRAAEAATRRRDRERRAASSRPQTHGEDTLGNDLCPILDRELAALPRR